MEKESSGCWLGRFEWKCPAQRLSVTGLLQCSLGLNLKLCLFPSAFFWAVFPLLPSQVSWWMVCKCRACSRTEAWVLSHVAYSAWCRFLKKTLLFSTKYLISSGAVWKKATCRELFWVVYLHETRCRCFWAWLITVFLLSFSSVCGTVLIQLSWLQ